MTTLGISAYFLGKAISHEIEEVSITTFMRLLNQNDITECLFEEKMCYFKAGGIWYLVNVALLTKDKLFSLLLTKPEIDVSSSTSVNYSTVINLLISGVTLYYSFQLLDQMNPGNNQPKRKHGKRSKVKFNDIFGHDQTKRELGQIIDYLKNPEEFNRIGARLRRGVLLYGPSGTGKTMLAKALANEAGVNFISESASSFVETFVGVGPRRVRDLFDAARNAAPCILFIDEIDALGSRNTSKDIFGKENTERNNTVNQFLTEMDGFHETDQVVVLGATNRQQFLDFAVVRSGRFDLKIPIGLPDLQARVGILKLKLSKIKTVPIDDSQIEELMKMANNLSGADIDAIVNEAIYMAKYDDSQEGVNFEHLVHSAEKVVKSLFQVNNLPQENK